MEISLLVLLCVFGLGLILGRKHPVLLAMVVALVVGVLISGNAAGEFVRTLLDEAYVLIT